MVHNEPPLGPANGCSSPLAEDFEITIHSESGLYYILVQTTLSFISRYTVTLSFELMAFLNGTTDSAVGGWSGASVVGSVLRFNPGNGNSGSASSNNKLDLRSFTKITFHIDRISSQDYSSSRVGIGADKTGGSFVASATMPTGAGAYETTNVTKVIDITNVDSGYIKIYGSSSNGSAQLRLDIDKILLE